MLLAGMALGTLEDGRSKLALFVVLGFEGQRSPEEEQCIWPP